MENCYEYDIFFESLFPHHLCSCCPFWDLAGNWWCAHRKPAICSFRSDFRCLVWDAGVVFLSEMVWKKHCSVRRKLQKGRVILGLLLLVLYLWFSRVPHKHRSSSYSSSSQYSSGRSSPCKSRGREGSDSSCDICILFS